MVRQRSRPALALEHLRRIPGKRVLAWHGRTLYASDGYQVARCEPEGDRWTWQPVARFHPGWVRRLGSRTRITRRLLRAGFHALEVLSSGRLVGVVAGAIVVADPGDTEFRPTFAIRRGTRPLALAVTSEETVYWGEYFANPRRDEVNIYGSDDHGDTWSVVHTFPKRSVKHVHRVIWDPYDRCLWVLTGDYGEECRILRVSPDWTDVETVLASDQQARAATGLPAPEGLYFATDTPLSQNYIYRLERSGRVDRLRAIAGSSLQSCEVGSHMFFSTAVEPSKVNRSPFATLVGGRNGQDWAEVARWRKDLFPAGLFQFGNILLPTGTNDSDLLAATGLAVNRHDMAMHVWRVVSRGDDESGH